MRADQCKTDNGNIITGIGPIAWPLRRFRLWGKFGGGQTRPVAEHALIGQNNPGVPEASSACHAILPQETRAGQYLKGRLYDKLFL